MLIFVCVSEHSVKMLIPTVWYVQSARFSSVVFTAKNNMSDDAQDIDDDEVVSQSEEEVEDDEDVEDEEEEEEEDPANG